MQIEIVIESEELNDAKTKENWNFFCGKFDLSASLHVSGSFNTDSKNTMQNDFPLILV